MSLNRKSRQGYYNLAYVMQIAGSDENFVLEMLRYFVQNTPAVLDRLAIYTGEENWENLAAEAHKFVPGLNFLGINTIEQKVRMVEEYAHSRTHLDELPGLVSDIALRGKEVVTVLIDDFQLV